MEAQVSPLDEVWNRIEEALGEVDPTGEGLRGPAQRTDLEALVPPAWRALWGRHDGQTSLLDGVFDGWFFLPLRGSVDSVEADAPSLPDGWVPLAKDFGGSFLAIRPDDDALVEWDVDEEGSTGTWAADVEELLAALADRLEAGDLPGRWAPGDDGHWRPESEVEVRVEDVEGLKVGEPAPLGHGLVLVRLALDAVPASSLPDLAHHLPFAVDCEEPDPDAMGRLVGVRVVRERGTGTVAVVQQGEQHWIEVEEGLHGRLTLLLTLDLQQPITGPRPLLGVHAEDPAQGAYAQLLLGDAEAGLARLSADDLDGATLGLRVRLLLAAGRAEEAAKRLEGTLGGGEIRARALLSAGRLDEALAAADAEAERGATPSLLRLRSRIRELAGDVAGAREDAEAALDAIGSPVGAAAVRSDLARLRRPATPSTPPEPEPDPLPVERVSTLEDGTLRVELTPDEAARGAVAVFERGDEAHGVRLPAGAGHGLVLTARLGEDAVRLEAHVVMPGAWEPEPGARNGAVSFDRWDVVAVVDLSDDEAADGAELAVATPNGLRTVSWPPGAVEVREAGAGLADPRGERGDLVVRRAG